MIILGVDPSLSATGLVLLDLRSTPVIKDMATITTSKNDHEGTYLESYPHMHRSSTLSEGINTFIKDNQYPDYVCIEVPQGSQSSAAALGSGVANAFCGILFNEFQESLLPTKPLWVKWDTIGKEAAKENKGKDSKKKIIEWAVNKFPEANWSKYRGVVALKNEHMADAVAIIYSAAMRHNKVDILELLP